MVSHPYLSLVRRTNIHRDAGHGLSEVQLFLLPPLDSPAARRLLWVITTNTMDVQPHRSYLFAANNLEKAPATGRVFVFIRKESRGGK